MTKLLEIIPNYHIYLLKAIIIITHTGDEFSKLSNLVIYKCNIPFELVIKNYCQKKALYLNWNMNLIFLILQCGISQEYPKERLNARYVILRKEKA